MEKRHVIQNQIITLVANDEVVKEQTEISKNLYSFYQKFFSKIVTFLDKRYLQDKNIYKTISIRQKASEIESPSMCSLRERYNRRGSKT